MNFIALKKPLNFMRYKQRFKFITFLREIPLGRCQQLQHEAKAGRTGVSEFYESLRPSWAPCALQCSGALFCLFLLAFPTKARCDAG